MDANTTISMIVGGVISALISWFFYWLSGRGFATQVQLLRDLNELQLRALEEAGLVRVNRDALGHPIGLVLQGAATMESAAATVSCEATVSRDQRNA
jgi:hypothetical protein